MPPRPEYDWFTRPEPLPHYVFFPWRDGIDVDVDRWCEARELPYVRGPRRRVDRQEWLCARFHDLAVAEQFAEAVSGFVTSKAEIDSAERERKRLEALKATARVHNEPVTIEVRKRQRMWIADGEYRGRRIIAEGLTRETAVEHWADAAKRG